MSQSPLYMDYAASTPLDPEVLKAMLPWYEVGGTGNASSLQNINGQRCARAIRIAKEQIAKAINARSPDEIIFTSGATEANNLALRSFPSCHVVSAATEHASILQTLLQANHDVSFSDLSPCGMADGVDVLKAVTPETRLISIMAVNNETGCINPVSEIREGLQNRAIAIHCDAAQALGKIKLDVQEMGVDMITLSAHKAYGPQGIGALYVRKELQGLITPQISGGGQQNGLRSGTLPVALIAGFGVAAQKASEIQQAEYNRLHDYSEILLNMLREANVSFDVNGQNLSERGLKWRVPHILNLRLDGIKSEWLLEAMPDISFSTGSACSAAGTDKPSHVLKAIGLSNEQAACSIRLSMGRFTSEDDIKACGKSLLHAIEMLQEYGDVA
jgi:cysteine desulfurase